MVMRFYGFRVLAFIVRMSMDNNRPVIQSVSMSEKSIVEDKQAKHDNQKPRGLF